MGSAKYNFGFVLDIFVVVVAYFIAFPKVIYSHAFLRQVLDWRLESSILLGYMRATLRSQIKKFEREPPEVSI